VDGEKKRMDLEFLEQVVWQVGTGTVTEQEF